MKMSSCPTDDIHSIYLDNELPPVYANQYEQHLKICPKCEAKLALLKKNHFALQSDAQNIRLDKIFLDDSFERLKTKLRYSKNTDLKTKRNFQFTNYIIPFAAAAAVFAAVILPVQFTEKTSQKSENPKNFAKITPIERPQNTPLSSQNVVINGNLYNDLTQNVNMSPSSNLKDVEVFRPNFNSENNITIQIKVPDIMGQEQKTMEIKLPQAFLQGYLR